ncbi:MAG: hypothetical protein JNK99_11525 [Candidatus Accumulibacter sp.]|uniref:sialate O-acetylesterase n=1 Tax=Accumulibacter sp. TaxID=2053492 RepID=UPI001A4C2C5F|nr:sialate O-acetylesterase [Accumulibacter sp.]MBL8395356.1 hypothetical protein [Accumulibacter sp.]
MSGRPYRWLLLALVLATLSLVGFTLRQQQRQAANLAARLEQITRVGSEAALPCAAIAAERPLVLLALGQSNAANHGSPADPDSEAITLISEGKCIRAVDPLPGATGTGGSIWRRLPEAMRQSGNKRPIVISVLAVDASSIDEWTRQNSALRQRLVTHLAALRALGLPPAYVLWQQGEADARQGISSSDYARHLDLLATTIDQAGIGAPIILARSTICRSDPYAAVRGAVEAKVATDRRFRLGPDTDTLAGDRFRHEGCHLSVAGLASAALMWASTITGELARAAPMSSPAAQPNQADAGR